MFAPLELTKPLKQFTLEKNLEGTLVNYVKPEYVSLKLHPELSEKWVQELIAQDPSIIGLGDLVLRDKERVQPRAGRLDLLLQDPESKRRYEVELQLGATDEAHIIRTIEYWDIERKRYPQYEHCAVIVAEDITSRFLNVISLFNGTIPLIAIQMKAVKFGDQISLIFTKVVDELSRGLVDEDEDAEAAPTDRAYWETKGSKQTVQDADQLLRIVKTFDPSIELKYNKFYIGLSKNGQACNFVVFRPRKRHVLVDLKVPGTDEITKLLQDSSLDGADYNAKWQFYRFGLEKNDIQKNEDVLKKLIELAYSNWSA